MLLETVRQYGHEKLDAAGETAWVRDRHLDWSLALAEEGALGIKGPEQSVWLHRLETEHDNLRAALAWSTLAGTMNTHNDSSDAAFIAKKLLAGDEIRFNRQCFGTM